MSGLDLLFPYQSCEDAIRYCIEITIKRQMPLQGGVSGASIYYVDAEVSFPGINKARKFPQLECVIKFSPEESFEHEKRNYDIIPKSLQEYFVSLEAPRVLIDGEFFMIMPYLHEYTTLAKIIFHGTESKAEMYLSKVCEIINELCFAELQLENVSSTVIDIGKTFSLYLAKIQLSFEKAENAYGCYPRMKGSSFTANGRSYSIPSYYFEKIAKYLTKLTPPFYTRMHGDCHPRNILFREKDDDLKIIDIDKLTDKGDYIYDFGTLIADIESFNTILQTRRPAFQFSIKDQSISYTLPESKKAKKACEQVITNVERIAKERNDTFWRERLELAKARYLLSMVPKTVDKEKACIVYCEGLRALSNVLDFIAK